MTRDYVNSLFKKELIFLDLEFDNYDKLFTKMAKKLNKLGYVKDSFGVALKKREEKYPTGLDIDPYEIAIPHADEEHVIEGAIAFIRLKNTVSFREMATLDKYLNVKFVFILMLKKGEYQIECLQMLIDFVQNKEKMAILLSENNPEKIYNFLKENIK